MARTKTYRFRFDGAPRGPIEGLPTPDKVTLSLLHSCGELVLPRSALADSQYSADRMKAIVL